jgi:hypothetical protein
MKTKNPKEDEIKNIDDNFFDELAKEIEKKNEELRAKAKKREDLIVPVYCYVTSVEGYLSQRKMTPHSERMIGGKSPSYNVGDSSRLELLVDTKEGIKYVNFAGWPPIEKGDSIKAYFLKGELKSEETKLGIQRISMRYNQLQSHWIERDFQETETALKIEKLRDGKVVATYHNKS